LIFSFHPVTVATISFCSLFDKTRGVDFSGATSGSISVTLRPPSLVVQRIVLPTATLLIRRREEYTAQQEQDFLAPEV
jgi:hypothetical protein